MPYLLSLAKCREVGEKHDTLVGQEKRAHVQNTDPPVEYTLFSCDSMLSVEAGLVRVGNSSSKSIRVTP